MQAARFLIATPVYDGTITIEYMASVRNAEAALGSEGVSCDLRFLVGTEIWKTRNTFASILLDNSDLTHSLFIDSDMVFQPSAVTKLLRSKKVFCGCICPYRSLDLTELHAVAREIPDPIAARNIAQPYVAADRLEVTKQDGRYEFAIRDGFVRTARIGCGITLIHRSVVETMANLMPYLLASDSQASEHQTSIQCFSPSSDDSGNFLSEDISFCLRWTKNCGGEIWACVDEEIGHVGRNVFFGRASDRLGYHGVRFTTR